MVSFKYVAIAGKNSIKADEFPRQPLLYLSCLPVFIAHTWQILLQTALQMCIPPTFLE